MAAERGARVVAVFDDAETLVAAVARLRQRGFAVRDAFTPYAVHALDAALGTRRSRLGWVTLAGGLAGALAAIALQIWTSAIDWPLDVGGKPALSPLAFLPVTFELTVLLAGLATAAAFFARSRLFPGARASAPAPGVTDDRFALVAGGGYPEVLGSLLREAGAREVWEVGG